MLTDAEARDLLHAAADTIEVDPAQPLPVVHRPLIWPMLVAAAAVIAVVVTTLALADRGTEPLPPSNPPIPRPSLAANVVPPVIGLDPDDALDLMSERRLDVRVTEDRAVRASGPWARSSRSETRSSSATQVVLRRDDPHAEGLFVTPPQPGLAFLRFALGVDPAPRFADR